MTEESEASDGERVNKHSLLWRSEKLNKLVRKLDTRSKEASGKNVFLKKERVEKYPSQESPPGNAPSWTLRSSADQAISTPSRLGVTTTTRSVQESGSDQE